MPPPALRAIVHDGTRDARFLGVEVGAGIRAGEVEAATTGRADVADQARTLEPYVAAIRVDSTAMVRSEIGRDLAAAVGQHRRIQAVDATALSAGVVVNERFAEQGELYLILRGDGKVGVRELNATVAVADHGHAVQHQLGRNRTVAEIHPSTGAAADFQTTQEHVMRTKNVQDAARARRGFQLGALPGCGLSAGAGGVAAFERQFALRRGQTDDGEGRNGVWPAGDPDDVALRSEEGGIDGRLNRDMGARGIGADAEGRAVGGFGAGECKEEGAQQEQTAHGSVSGGFDPIDEDSLANPPHLRAGPRRGPAPTQLRHFARYSPHGRPL